MTVSSQLGCFLFIRMISVLLTRTGRDLQTKLHWLNETFGSTDYPKKQLTLCGLVDIIENVVKAIDATFQRQIDGG